MPATAAPGVNLSGNNEIEPTSLQTESVRIRSKDLKHSEHGSNGSSSSHDVAPGLNGHGPVEMVRTSADGIEEREYEQNSGAAAATGKRKQWFKYLRTKQFWILLLAGQILSFCITGTNTFSFLLNGEGVSIPAFQSFFNYVLLNIVWTSVTIYKYGWKGWANMVWTQGWRYIILSFFDVEGNYFTVLGYRYTTILSAQLINFFAIAVVVVMSFIFLHVRYKLPQVAGILVCLAGMGLLMASDKITGVNNFPVEDQLKGDLFCLLGAFFYGLSNTFQEFLVSKRPLYEVVGQLAFWGMIINGVQAAIFDRESFQAATWSVKSGGYVAGFDLLLFVFYSLAPIVFRMGSAAFLNISLLTSNFWGTIVGIQVFGLSVHWLYPVAFVLIMVGLIIYFVMDGSTTGDQAKPWLGENQEQGVSGVGTARRRIERPDALV